MDPLGYVGILKMAGNECYKKGHYVQAVLKYDEAIGLLYHLWSTGNSMMTIQKDLAVLFCNRANSLFKLGKWKEALQSSNDSFVNDPSHFKAYYRAGCCFLKLNLIDAAVNIFCRGLQILSGTSNKDDVVDFLSEIFMAFEVGRNSVGFYMALQDVLRERYSKHIWKSVIEKLVQREMYASCLFLKSISDKLPSNINNLHLSLKGIFQTYLKSIQHHDMTSVAELVTWLINMGANVESIGNYPLHATLKICLKTGDNRLFQLVLNKNPAMKNNINQKDENGSTLLHIVASSPISSWYTVNRQAQDVKMLLDYGCDPHVANEEGQDASVILKKNKCFKAGDVIRKHIENQVKSAVLTSKPAEKCENAFTEDKATSFVGALEQFIDFCNQKTTQSAKATDFLKHKKVKHFLHALSTMEEIPPEWTCDIPESVVQLLLVHLISHGKWQHIMLLMTRNASGQTEKGEQGLLKKCPLPHINIGEVIRRLDHSLALRLPLVKLLLDQGVSPDGIGAGCEAPMKTCLKNKDFALAYLLLSKGGNPQNLSLEKGDTPLHAAISISFRNKEDGDGIWMLKYLLDLYSSESSKYPYLDPNKQDSNGNTVMHQVFKSDNPKQYRKVMDLLAKFDISLTVTNKQGHDAKYKVKNTDPRFIAWNEAKKKHKHKFCSIPVKNTTGESAQHKPQVKFQNPMPFSAKGNGKVTMIQVGLFEQASNEPSSEILEHGNKAMTLRENLVQEIQGLIKNMETSKMTTESDTSSLSGVINANNEEIGGLPVICSDKRIASTNDQQEVASAITNGAADFSDHELSAVCNGEEENEILEEEELDLSQIDFNNMTWEIECAPEALKKLGSKAVSHIIKSKIIISIQKLGNGEWTRSLHKPLKCSKSNIKLYEVKLDKGGRMLWELAIDFSPRCSEEPEKIMESELSHHASEKTGRVYTEIIRIWDIVLDHDKISKAIENICSSYNRGLNCILRKKLKIITKTPLSSSVEKRIPKYFVEDTELERNMVHFASDYCPPASAAETEYNIMKFHSFSTDMALNILSNMNSRIEYPFRVGELEYAVIDLNPQPMEAIILIGRSGTGKTTCCMYRLWKKFHSYWEKAELGGGPWIVKQTWQRRKYENNNDQHDTEDEETTETETSDSTDEEQIPLEEEDFGEDVVSQESEEDKEESVKLEHYHPVFVTKNHVLCQEVQRNFLELSKSAKATSHFKPVEPNVYKLQSLQDENFPLFLTSQQLLLLVDASMPDPFFPRNEDGSLKKSIIGWSLSEEVDIPDLLREDDEGDADLDEEEEATCELKETDPRVFVTFEVFTNELWPKMVKGKSLYNAALVWKEIKSFLKGSFEALNCHQGKLTEEQYIKLGKKRAPHFQEDRKEIYHLFCLYEQIKSKKGYFDEEDLLYNLSCRVSKLEELPWSIHELYGDEIQDFTQAELFLLMRCSNDPNSMFLTGDTAQSIMKGVAFRFSDLRSLFYYASKNCANREKNCIVRKPKRIYQLYQNYRSHSGILLLASSVVDLLQYYFPESFDRLPRDCGLFDGPKPTVLESCSVSDLAILLRGNKRKTQPIEFGAHQVILVTNEAAKEKIPEELSLALVLTIYEAKGLEFDDVLLYNFFTDSEAAKEWRLISSFNPVIHNNDDGRTIIEVPLDDISTPSCRPLTMNPEMHKMLNGELKQLYTAITRARVNLWIFDENQEKRAPAFEYFIKGNLVKVVRTDENKDFDDKMFVKTSTKEEWIAQGDYYAKHKCWKVAAKCYQKGGATNKEKIAFSHDAVLNLQSKKANTRDKIEYMRLAKIYLECAEPKLALKCLTWAKEYHLCAEICKKAQKIKEAGHFYKRIKENKVAVDCFEEAGEFQLALDLCIQEKMHEEAAAIIERHTQKNPDVQLAHSAKKFYLEAAADHFNNNRLKKMNEVLAKINIDDHLLFLKTRKCWSEAADLLRQRGRCEEAALLMREHGKLLEAAEMTTKKDFRALCLLAAARCMVAENKDPGNVLTEAIKLFTEIENRTGIYEGTLLQGIVEKESGKLHLAFKHFITMSHSAGAVEALFHSVKSGKTDEQLLFMASTGLQSLVTLVKALKEIKSNSQKEMVKSCLDFYGVLQVDGEQCYIPQCEGARIIEISTDENIDIKDKKIKDKMYCLELQDVKLVLERHFLRRLCEISVHVFAQVYPDICPKFIAGLDCADENCTDFHQPLQRYALIKIVQNKINLITISGLLLESKLLSKELSHAFQDILNDYAYRFCSSLLNLFFPKHFHLRISYENSVACKKFQDILKKFPLPGKAMMNKYVESIFQEADDRTRRESTDLWLKATQIFILSSCYPDGLKCFLDKEERQYNREYLFQKKKMNEHWGDGKKIKFIEGRYGMLKPSGGSLHIHFFRLLDGALEQLYVHKNPEECKTYFYRFMNVFIMKCTEPLIPNIGNMVMLLEFQFILCSAVLIRFGLGTKVLLPKSYISLLHHWELMFRRRGNRALIKDTYYILWDFKPKDMRQTMKRFRHHIFYLAAVLCGQENEAFNVLLDAFSDIDYISSGEAERTLVLCLVMMVNVKGVVDTKAEHILWSNFSEIQTKLRNMKDNFPSRVPKRLVSIVDTVVMTSNVEEVVDVLQSLLEKRDEERLVECCWRWDSNNGKGQVHGIFFEDRFIFKKFVHVQHFVQDSKYAHVDNDQEDFPENKEDLVTALASQVQQKHSVMRMFDDLLLLVCFCIKWKRATQRMKTKQMEESIPETFKKANVDRTQCDLCGVKFSHGSSFSALSEEAEEDNPEAVTPTRNDVGSSVDFSSQLQDVTETYEGHITLDKHAKQSKAYSNYLQYYNTVNVDDVLSRGKYLMEITGDQMISREEFQLEQKKIENKIKIIADLMDDIYEKKLWSEAQELLEFPVNDLNTSIQAVENLLEINEQHMANNKGIQKKDMFEHEIDYGGFEELKRKKAKRSKKKTRR
ncbi:TPR and ankyrin repeat-containing protein 1 [Pelodytes ibericus]